MSWVEIIHVRNSDASLSATVQDYVRSLRRSLERDGMTGLQMYGNIALPMDVSIHLRWSGAPPDIGGSPAGKRIAYQLRQHTAAVSHSVWTALEEFTITESDKIE